jgi:DNA-binding MarR family transcriptional regulator
MWVSADFPALRTTVRPATTESTVRSPGAFRLPEVVVWYNQPVTPAATHDPADAPDAPHSDVARVIAGVRAVIGTAKSPRAHQRQVSETGVNVERAGVVALAILADRGPLRLSELAAALQVDISTASRQVRKLEDADLVGRTPDEQDRRASLLHLTEHGRDSQRRLRAHWHRRMASALTDLTPQEQATLADLVERLAAGLQRTLGDER